MTAFTVEVVDQQARAALKTLADRVQRPRAVMRAIAEGITERTKHRFDTSTAPDGTPWAPHSAATIQMLAERLINHRNKKGARSYAYSKQGGLLNGKGLSQLGGKKLLIESGFLRQQIVPSSTATSLSVTATALYAAIHQFGGQAGRGRKVTIPARPFLPVHKDGSLYPQETELILGEINAFLMEGLT